MTMNSSILLSAQVISKLQSLPAEDRKVVTQAVAYDLILGIPSGTELSAVQYLVYSLIKESVQRDTVKFNNFSILP